MTTLVKELKRAQRRRRVRKKVVGTAERPRLSVFRSNQNIYVQAIDDVDGKTLVSASSLSKELKETASGEKKTAQAQKVGELIAERLKKKKITTVVFDRNGYQYHGRVKSLADGARNGGLVF